MPYAIISTLVSLATATLLFSASFEIRFDLGETLVLYAPALVLGGCVVLANILDRRYLVQRLKVAMLFVFLASASFYSFALGGFQESGILGRILINCSLGFLIVVYPWNRRSLSLLFLIIVVFGCLLALNTLAVYDTLGSRRGYEEEIREGYLNVTFVAAVASICALYRLIERIDPINIALFALCWIGTALSLGRGALLFGAFVSILYLLFALVTRLSTMGRVKKTLMLVLFACTTPIVFIQAMSVERTAQRLATLFGDAEASSGVGARFNVHEVALNNFLDKPIFGNGLGAYLGDSVSSIGYPHNIVLQYLVDGGLIGGLVVSVFLIAVFLLLLAALRRSTPDSRNLVLASAALYLFMVLSYMKSHDAYRGLEMFLLSGVAMAAYCALHFEAPFRRRRNVRRRTRSSRLRLENAGS